MEATSADQIKDFAFTTQFLATLVDGARHGEALTERSRHVVTELPMLFLQGRSGQSAPFKSVSKELDWCDLMYRSSENPEDALWWQATVFVDDEVADAASVAADELAAIVHGDPLVDAFRSLALLFTKDIASKTLTLVYELPGPLELCRDFTDAELAGLLSTEVRDTSV